jgi:hypothetical protein
VAQAGPATQGLLNVYLVTDGQASLFSHMNLLISGMAMEVGGVWTNVPLNPDPAAPTDPTTSAPGPPATQTVDLLAPLTSAAPASLATKVPWPEGLNTTFRFELAQGATVTLASDDAATPHPLVVQRTLMAGMGLPGGFNVVGGTSTDMVIVLNLNNATSPDLTDPASFDFVPLAVRGYDKAATGTLKGTLTGNPPDQGSGTAAPVPLAGVTVTAQLQEPLSAGGAGVSFRQTTTADPDGTYALDLLPLGYTWCAVAQPPGGPVVYEAQAGDGVRLGDVPYNTGTSNAVFSPAGPTGTLTGTLTTIPPALGEVDVVDLMETFPAGVDGTPFSVTVQSTPVAAGAFSFPLVPPGIYFAVLNRYTYSPTLGITFLPDATNAFLIASGNTTAIHF